MKGYLSPILILLAFLTSSVGNAEDIKHRILVSGCGLGAISIIGEDAQTEWSMLIATEVSDSILLKNGNVLHSCKTEGIREIKPDYASGKGGKTVWEWKPEVINGKSGEVHSCQLLPDGKILVGESHDGISYLKEIDHATGKVVKSVELKGLGDQHSTFRQVRKTPTGTYLITHFSGKASAKEFDAQGKLLRTFPDGKYTAIRLPNKNTLISCGDSHRIIEVDETNKIVWEIKQNDLEGVSLGFAAGLQRLPNGNTVIVNWGGHGGAKGPAVIEVTPDKKVVWQTTTGIKNMVSSIQILDKNIQSKEQLR